VISKSGGGGVLSSYQLSSASYVKTRLLLIAMSLMLHVRGCVQYERDQLEAHLEEEGDRGMVLIVLLSGDVVVSLPPK
jgi:hypothetical protein